MRSKFEFTGLNKENDPVDGYGDAIFFNMLDIAENGNLKFCTENASKIFNSIPDGKYWIAQDAVSYKGKKRLFLGSGVVCALKEEINKFIEKLIEKEDLRAFLLCPVLENDPEFVVFISDEGVFFLYEKPA
jgi:hypothetical protein